MLFSCPYLEAMREAHQFGTGRQFQQESLTAISIFWRNGLVPRAAAGMAADPFWFGSGLWGRRAGQHIPRAEFLAGACSVMGAMSRGSFQETSGTTCFLVLTRTMTTVYYTMYYYSAYAMNSSHRILSCIISTTVHNRRQLLPYWISHFVVCSISHSQHPRTRMAKYASHPCAIDQPPDAPEIRCPDCPVTFTLPKSPAEVFPRLQRAPLALKSTNTQLQCTND